MANILTMIKKAKENRKQTMQKNQLMTWDYVIIGAGIIGVQTFRILSNKGFKVLLIDSNDFSSGTSSNSGMLIWGGLLYLKTMDIKSILNFSRSRDRLIDKDTKNIKVLPVTYLSNKKNIFVDLALWFYWMMSFFKRKQPYRNTQLIEGGEFNKKYQYKHVFEEALIQSSDSRYVIDLLMANLNQNPNSQAHNYLELINGKFEHSNWELTLNDKICGKKANIVTKNVINCAGVGVDNVNEILEIQDSPYRHLWSKGVYLNLVRNQNHKSMLIFDDPNNDDVLTFCPVGNVSFFGPTEENIDKDRSTAFQLTNNDISQLKSNYLFCTGKNLKREDIVAFRVGIRSLCVPRSYSDQGYTLGISRRSKIYHLPQKNYAAAYGGKFTGSYKLAKKIVKCFDVKNVPPETRVTSYWQSKYCQSQTIDTTTAVMREQCWTLKDYLRHRTFIHQSVPNGGFGLNFEFREKLAKLSVNFLDDPACFDVEFEAYLAEQQELNTLFEESMNGN